jgi:hypothetical protein
MPIEESTPPVNWVFAAYNYINLTTFQSIPSEKGDVLHNEYR